MKFIKKYGKRFIPLFVLCCILLCSFDIHKVFADTVYLHPVTHYDPDKDSNYTVTYEYKNSGNVMTASVLYKNGSYDACTTLAVSLTPFIPINGCYVNIYHHNSHLGSNKTAVLTSGDLSIYVCFLTYYSSIINCDFNDLIYSSDAIVRTCQFDDFDTYVDTEDEINKYFSGSIANVLGQMLFMNKSEGLEWINGGPSDNENAVDEIGYLQNISCVTNNIDVSSSHTIPVLKFSFSTTTSTGKKLYDDGMDVQYMLTAQSYDGKSAFDSRTVCKSAKSDLFLLSDNEHVYDDSHLNSLNTGTLWFSSTSDTWQNMYSEIKDGLSAFSNMYFERQFFLRPIYRENVHAPVQYGGWSRVTINTDGSIDVEDGFIPQSDENPDSSPGSDGNLDNVTNEYKGEHSIGSGDNLDDAESNSKEWDKVFDSVDDIMDTFDEFDIRSLDDIFNQLSQSVKGFANLFSIVFSWVPQWLQYSIIAAISIWVFMLIKKAIFG